MHILIIETILDGHHSVYLERIASAYMDAGHLVTVTVLKCNIKHDVINRLKRRYGAAFDTFIFDGEKYSAALNSKVGLYGREFSLRRIFGQTYLLVNKNRKVDYIFLPYLDYCLYAFGMLGAPFGSTLWGGICMRPSFHYRDSGIIAPKPKISSIKKFLFLKMLRDKNIKSCFSIDKLLCCYVSDNYPQLAQKLLYVPDPAELKGNYDYNSARQELDVPADSILILVYGAIDERKGLETLVDALTESVLLTRFQILVVGQQSETMRALFNSDKFNKLVEKKRCYVIDKFVNEVTQQMVFSASDIVWLGYRNHYTMSGVLVMAGIASKPVISNVAGLLGWYTKENDLGSTFELHRSEDVVEALCKLISKGVRLNSGLNSNRVFIGNSWEHFLDAIALPRRL